MPSPGHRDDISDALGLVELQVARRLQPNSTQVRLDLPSERADPAVADKGQACREVEQTLDADAGVLRRTGGLDRRGRLGIDFPAVEIVAVWKRIAGDDGVQLALDPQPAEVDRSVDTHDELIRQWADGLD